MLRRPPPTPPPAPLGLDDLEPASRPPLVTRRTLARLAALFVGGLAWGLVVRFADSLPVDAGFVAFVPKVGGGFVFVLAIALVLVFRGFEVDRVMIGAFAAILGAVIGLNVGPTVAPPVEVAGTYSFVPTAPAGMPPSAGPAACEWAAGRWKVGAIGAGPLEGLATPHRLDIDFLRKTITLADGEGSTLLAVGNAAFEPPPDSPPREPGDRSGTLDLQLLQVDGASTPDDPNEVSGRFSWECPGPPDEPLDEPSG